MHHLFADYETSKMLKELGFDEPCMTLYSSLKGEPESIICDFHALEFIVNDELNESWCTAPLWQQVEEWLFEKHDMWFQVQKHYEEFICSRHRYMDYRHYEYRNETPVKAKIEAIQQTVKFLHQQLNKKS